MKFFQEEKGLTLLEVLLAISILSIIFISFLSFFPQMGFINKENENKAQAINTAKEVLLEWQNSQELKNYIKTPSNNPPAGYVSKDSTFYYFKDVKVGFDVDIKIKIATDIKSTPTKTHLIQIELKNKRNNVVSDTYGYIIIE
ncbi:prepilin-type N-terminal cleavage/methylation domain-containing protein [Neobacillus sp. YX16]|uniref:prepilin-type N-terminal cleavage/methylation domain-containing protein n=1 Tax=Neobacillus sp. YX16 TaxID=3047874 RepID=UPI0024C3024C|nr:prepilin-type N-terminal cleavage/methylation domain-containing protein [Neobacillus sp. YX16]WHZ01907.1 prepilin-type N-terminal cleavage/methylation domain-containing protein [Neobacillus sp. YX16]